MPEKPLNTPQLNQLFHSYSAGDLAHTERNAAAFANDVYDLTDTDGQRYVMRILKDQLPESVAWEAAVQRRLIAHGIRTPLYLQLNNDGFVGEHDGTTFTLSKRIEGSAPVKIREELVTDLGSTLAKIHSCLEGIRVPHSYMQWFNRDNALGELHAYAGSLKPKLEHLFNEGSHVFNLGLPQAVIHGDFWVGNIFAEDGKVTAVFDFETAENTLRIIDLARTYTSVRRETEISLKEITNMLFSGYDSSADKPLTNEERNNFKLAVAYVSGVVATWHAVHGTKYTGPYIELGEEALVVL